VAAGRHPEPSADIVDSQSVAESAEGVVPVATSGYDGSKKVNGRKRHLLADTLGLLITLAVTAANVLDRNADAVLAVRSRRRCARDYERTPPITRPWSTGPPSSR
jgi:DDE family transposase